MFKIGCACAKTVSNQETEEDEDETDDIKVPPKKSGCWQSWELMVKLYAHVAILGNFEVELAEVELTDVPTVLVAVDPTVVTT